MITKVLFIICYIAFGIGTVGQFIWIDLAPDELFHHHWTVAGVGLSIFMLVFPVAIYRLLNT